MPQGLISRAEWQAERALRADFIEAPAIYIFTTFDTHIAPCFSLRKCINDVQFLQRDTMKNRKLPDLTYKPQTLMYYIQHSQTVESPGGLRIISRDEWGAVDPLWVKFLVLPVEHVFFEYTNTEECHDRDTCMDAVRGIQRYNLKLRDNPDIRYNFLIASDGVVYEGRGWDSAPRLPQRYSNVRRHAMYIALIGTYADHAPSEKVFQARIDLIKHGVSLKYVKEKHLEYSILTPRTLDKDQRTHDDPT